MKRLLKIIALIGGFAIGWMLADLYRIVSAMGGGHG